MAKASVEQIMGKFQKQMNDILEGYAEQKYTMGASVAKETYLIFLNAAGDVMSREVDWKNDEAMQALITYTAVLLCGVIILSGAADV